MKGSPTYDELVDIARDKIIGAAINFCWEANEHSEQVLRDAVADYRVAVGMKRLDEWMPEPDPRVGVPPFDA